jgi:DNA-binding GntR family transcriptional regulator
MDTTGRRVSGAQVVYRSLYDRITRLDLAPGTRLHETELAASLAVSRTPLREALRMLLSDGLVHQLPTGGMVVAPLDPQEMQHLYEVRAVLEGVVARQACEALTDGAVVELERIVDQMRRLVDYPDEMLRLGNAFHARLLDLSRNRYAAQVLQLLRGHLSRYQAITATIEPRRRAALDEHSGILDALRGGDTQLAETRMRDHVLAAYRHGSRHTQDFDRARPAQA